MTHVFSGQGGGLQSWKHVVPRPPFSFYPGAHTRRYGYEAVFLWFSEIPEIGAGWGKGRKAPAPPKEIGRAGR